MSEWIKKQDPTVYCLPEMHFKCKHNTPKGKSYVTQTLIIKKADMAIFLSKYTSRQREILNENKMSKSPGRHDNP